MAEQVAPMACGPLHGNEETVPPAEAPAEEPSAEDPPPEEPSAEDPPPEEPSAEDPPPEEPPAKETVPLETEVLPKAEETAEEKQERHEARAKAIKERQDQLKAEIIQGIEARMEKTETNRMGKEDHRPGEDEVQPPVAPPEEQEPGPAAKDGRLPFNVFGSEAAAPGAELKVKEEAEDSDQEGEPALVVQDLRHCNACKSKSYIRQGLCINIYCKLYYMGRADCDRRLCARGKLHEGRKWSPKEWVDSGSYAQVEEQLLKDSFDEAMKEVEGLPPPVKSIPLPAKALVESGPIIIEDMETGEVLNPESSGSKPDAAPENDEASMEKALLAATRRVRNKGWKRVQALAEKISEKKARGEWKGPNIPLPKEAYEHLQSAASKIQDKVDPNKDWKYDDWKKW